MKHKATLISVMTEKVFEKFIIEVLEEEGAKGYTIFDGLGGGSFHSSHHQQGSIVNELKIFKLEAIVLDASIAERIAERLMEEHFVDQPGFVALSDVEVFRAQKF